MCKIEGLNAHQIGGCLSIVAYSIFLPSYFSRNHPLLFPFSLFASTSPTRKYLSTFSRGIHRSESLFRKADKHTNGNFQGSDEWSIDLVENKDWCLRGDRVRCQLSGTRTGRHFGERYATWRFGTVSNLPHGHQVINFGSIYHNKSVKWIFPFRSMILSRRINDDDHRDGFTKWPFMTTHTWGEYPQGNWLLEVSNRVVPFLSSSLSWENRVFEISYRITFRPGELQYSNASARMDQRVDPDAARHQRAALHRASCSRSTFQIGDREESARGTIVGYVTTTTKKKKTLDTFISRHVHASTSLIV